MFTFLNYLHLIALSLVLYVVSKLFSAKKIPKGLKALPILNGWPIVGNLLSIHEPSCKFLFKASKKFGPIFSFKMGMREIVVLSSNKILSKTLKEMGNNFSGRWQNVLIKTSVHDSGILFKDKELWAIQRSFILKVLRDFGLGKQRANEIVSNECSILLREIEESVGKVVSARFFFPKFTVNVIAKLVMNMRFEREQSDFKNLTAIIEQTAQNTNIFVTAILMFPILDSFPRFAQFLLWCSGRDQELEKIHGYFKKIINEHKSRFTAENDAEDLIDTFLKEQHKLQAEGVKDHTFTEWQLIRVVFELFAAGYETTSTTLTWSMLILAKYSAVQDKIYRELVDVLGSDRMPAFADKKSLPYTQAVMDELFRYTSVVPLSITHRVFENTEVEGFYIPKDSIVFPNLYACHRDKDVWEKPFDFYPEHFIETKEDGTIKYTPRDELVPFSIGKRQCLGEGLARMEFFVFLTSILQRFKVRFDQPKTDEEFLKLTEGTDGTIRAPLTSEVVFELRQ